MVVQLLTRLFSIIWDLRSPAAPQQTPNRIALNPVLRIDWRRCLLCWLPYDPKISHSDVYCHLAFIQPT